MQWLTVRLSIFALAAAHREAILWSRGRAVNHFVAAAADPAHCTAENSQESLAKLTKKLQLGILALLMFHLILENPQFASRNLQYVRD